MIRRAALVSVLALAGCLHVASSDCADGKEVKMDVFTRELELEGDLSEEQRLRLLEIADKCPVHNTLEHTSKIDTRLK